MSADEGRGVPGARKRGPRTEPDARERAQARRKEEQSSKRDPVGREALADAIAAARRSLEESRARAVRAGAEDGAGAATGAVAKKKSAKKKSAKKRAQRKASKKKVARQGQAQARAAATREASEVPGPSFAASDEALERLASWMVERGYEPHAFQRRAWAAFLAGRSGLIHVPTGSGKTFAALFGPLAEAATHPRGQLRVVYLSPLRAVSVDIQKAVQRPAQEAGLGLRVAARTGDSSASERRKLRESPSEVLVTTPESLALLLTAEDAARRFEGLLAVVVDEWHELVDGKRGALLQLSLARLRRFAPRLRTWAMSATVGDVPLAARAVVAVGEEPLVIGADIERPVHVETLLPDKVDPFPWAGHLGLGMAQRLADALADGVTTLVFTNTRFQAETWYRALLDERPDWAGQIALHHGSLSPRERALVEEGLSQGTLRAAVATSSLDLGVDFTPVERVVQIGSPKGIARLLQRAGRAAHRPGAACTLVFVPTNSLELLEIAAAREAIAAGRVEARLPPERPLDVLAQHLVTAALGGGFTREEVFEEVRAAWSYRELSEEELDWVIDLGVRGGRSLEAYPEFTKIVIREGRYTVLNRRVAAIHRLNVGTISADAAVIVQLIGGKRLGTIEERYVSGLQSGEVFVFAGRALEFVRLEETVAKVRLSKTAATARSPQWMGGRMPLSSELSHAVRELVSREAAAGDRATGGRAPELERAEPILEAQRRLSHLPSADELLIELIEDRDGSHLFLYPFEGRLVHEGLGIVLASRLGERSALTLSVAVNDYGVQLLAPKGHRFEPALHEGLFAEQGLEEAIASGMALAQSETRQFREVAQVSGLVVQNVPGAPRAMRQLQASASLLWKVFREHDPDHLLLHQARREVLESSFEQTRLIATLQRLRGARWRIERSPRLTPFAFPLAVEQIRARLSTESLADRIARMRAEALR